jgi:hypothetical protein
MMIYALLEIALTKNLEGTIPWEISLFVERMFRVDTTCFAVAARTILADLGTVVSF